MPTTTIYEQLIAVTKHPLKPGESYTDFAKHSVKKVNSLSDAKWKELSDELQTWNNQALAAFEANPEAPELPELEGLPEVADPETGEVTEPEAEPGEEEAPARPKAAKKGKPAKPVKAKKAK